MKPSWIVIGLGFGDEGKGTIVDALVRKTGASTVVRFNGGAQAAHNVVTPEGRHHTFSQWGSGTLAGAATVLSKDVVVDPLAMIQEAYSLCYLGLRDPLTLLTVDERALVSTPFHGAMSKVREIVRGADRHGTCGVGVGEAVRESLDAGIDKDCLLHAGDLQHHHEIRWRLRLTRQHCAAEATKLLAEARVVTAEAALAMTMLNSEELEETAAQDMATVGRRIRIASWDQIAETLRGGNLVFEGAQGVLLDEWHGFHPHTTWSTTTGDNARAVFINAGVGGDLKTVGVTRAYATRHGQGPFPSENGLGPRAGEHNEGGGWQGPFRVGWFDAVLTRYAIGVDGGVDALAVTCVDQQDFGDRTCVAYDSEFGRVTRLRVQRGVRDLAARQKVGEFLRTVQPVTERLWTPEHMSIELGVPLLVESNGPRSDQKNWRTVPLPGDWRNI
jgi:adenylosuccinate synthase